MKAYLLTLLAASMVTALVGILAPSGEKGGIEKHMKLLTSLFLVCVILAPLSDLLGKWNGSPENGLLPAPESGSQENSYKEQMEQALQAASSTYFIKLLTGLLEEEFDIAHGEVVCSVQWSQSGDSLTPSHVTLILSGRAIWKDPRPMEAFVSDLLGCSCNSAIE